MWILELAHAEPRRGLLFSSLIRPEPKPERLGGFAEAADFSNLDWLEITVDRQRGDQAKLQTMGEHLRSNPTATSLKHRL